MSRVVVTFLTMPNMDINLFDDAPDSVDTIVYILSDITNFSWPASLVLWVMRL